MTRQAHARTFARKCAHTQARSRTFTRFATKCQLNHLWILAHNAQNRKTYICKLTQDNLNFVYLPLYFHDWVEVGVGYARGLLECMLFTMHESTEAYKNMSLLQKQFHIEKND